MTRWSAGHQVAVDSKTKYTCLLIRRTLFGWEIRSLLVLLGGQSDRYQYMSILWQLARVSLGSSLPLILSSGRSKRVIYLIFALRYHIYIAKINTLWNVKITAFHLFLCHINLFKIIKTNYRMMSVNIIRYSL